MDDKHPELSIDQDFHLPGFHVLEYSLLFHIEKLTKLKKNPRTEAPPFTIIFISLLSLGCTRSQRHVHHQALRASHWQEWCGL